MPFWACLIDFSCRTLKIFFDVYLLTTFLDLQLYFISVKSQQLSAQDLHFTCFNRFIITWSMILVFLNFLHSAANLVYNSLFKYHTSLSNTFGYTFFSELFSLLFVPFVDFLTVMTLLYLFYYQGMHHIRSENAEVKNRGNIDGAIES